MPDLKTTYMGLALDNPVVAGSSTHTGSVEKVMALEAAGAGAVVLRSIFEEQIRADVQDMVETLENQDNPEAYDYIRADYPMQIGPEHYLDVIRQAKAALRIPVIASLNCVTRDHWIAYARKIEQAGADGLELNVYDIPQDPDETAGVVEERHLRLVEGIRRELRIPLAVKIGAHYTSIPNVVRRLAALEVQAVVLFNRFFQPEIDIEALALRPGLNFSRPQDAGLPVRWIALLRHHVSCDLAMTTGVHDAERAIQGLLAGATVVQVCSALYSPSGTAVVGAILEGVRDWMVRHGVERLDGMRGRMAEPADGAGRGFARAQYVKQFLSLESS